MADLLLGGGHAAVDLVGRVGAAAGEAATQLGNIRANPYSDSYSADAAKSYWDKMVTTASSAWKSGNRLANRRRAELNWMLSWWRGSCA